jgi:4-amino-4-deoxy-L-arabinose transferase-like glycosyltransferase
MLSKLTHDKTSRFTLVAILIILGVTHAQNMLQFPYYHNDEGTNIANAMAVAQGHDLSPYTYAYEEPPLGSFLLAIWMRITQGVTDAGFSLYAGRILMLGLHLITAALIFGIAKKSTRSTLAAAVATLMFSFSPLAIAIQRTVILDNIMIVWLLLAFYLVLGDERKLGHYFASAGFFGLAVLTKGSSLCFLPAFIYIISRQADRHHRRFATVLWAAMAGFLIAFYPLYAQMREELFPEGTLLGGSFPHVSLIERLLDRGPDTGRFLNIGSGLSQSYDSWVNIANITADPILIYAGLISFIFIFLLAIDNVRLRPIVAMTISGLLFLIFGGQVYTTDILSLLPFLAITTGALVSSIATFASAKATASVFRYGIAGVIMVVLLYPFWIYYSNRLDVYTLNQVDGQVAAVDWLARNVPTDAVIVTDNYAFTDLRKTHPNAQNYWKVDTDPDIKFTLLEDDMCNIDYILWTQQVSVDIERGKLDLMRRAYENSELLMSYPNNGWPVEIRQVNKLGCTTELVRNTNG